MGDVGETTLTSLDEFQLVGLALLAVVVFAILFVAFRRLLRGAGSGPAAPVGDQESRLLELTMAISRELQLQPLLQKIMDAVTDILDADRSTLFLHDPATDELWSNVAQGLGDSEIRFPSSAGIAGTVFTSGDIINIPNAYEDERFNQDVDKKTGYRTKSILTLPVMTKQGRTIGVIQVLNRRTGTFDLSDIRRLQAFCSQASIAIENAQLFEEVVRAKNYNEAVLESMKNAVITVDAEGVIVKANGAALSLLGVEDDPDVLMGRSVDEVFVGDDAWVAESVARIQATGATDETLDAVLSFPGEDGRPASTSVNLGVHPLHDVNHERMGCLVVIEDITTEKRLRSTMARYMTKEVADKLLEVGGESLGGTVQRATVLFSDIRAFTPFAERNGPTETVAMLNEYFGIMVDLILSHGGILDKYIGDAIMAVFGAPFTSPTDADNAVRTAVAMQHALTDFNAARTLLGKETIAVGIGVNTDHVVSGNIGSDKRMDYTVIGDGVNLAARLESATKTYGCPVLLSEFTAHELDGRHLLREVDRLRVQGKQQPVAIYEVLDVYPEDHIPHLDDVLTTWSRALELYRHQEWSGAIETLDQVLGLYPEDTISKLYRDRCTLFLEHPPDADWDGTWLMTTK